MMILIIDRSSYPLQNTLSLCIILLILNGPGSVISPYTDPWDTPYKSITLSGSNAFSRLKITFLKLLAYLNVVPTKARVLFVHAFELGLLGYILFQTISEFLADSIRGLVRPNLKMRFVNI